MKASWNTGPYELELLEAIAAVNQTVFFPALNELFSSNIEFEKTNKNLYDFMLNFDALKSLSASTVELWNLLLSSRLHLPRIQAYYQYYDSVVVNTIESSTKCSVWVSYKSMQACSVEQIENAVNSPGSSRSHELLPFDHIYQPNLDHPIDFYNDNMTNTDVFILYADMDDVQTRSFHNYLFRRANKESIAYIIRWKPSRSLRNAPLLSGFGVELTIKSTEYKVVNDEDDGRNNFNANDQPQSILLFGHDFIRLSNEYPDKIRPLDEFEDTLKQYADYKDKVPLLKGNHIGDIGFRLSSIAIQSPVSLHTLKCLSRDLPLFAESLSKFPINEQLVKQVSEIKKLKVGYDLFINGLGLRADKLNIFGLINILKIESNVIETLKSIGFTSDEARMIISHSRPQPMKSKVDQEAYDIRDEFEIPGNSNISPLQSIFWWNDVERDKRYQGYSRNLYDIMQMMGNGGIPRIKKNLYTVVFAVNILSQLGLDVINWSIDLITSNIPIRFGILPLFEPNDDGKSELVYRCLLFINERHGKKYAGNFVKILQNRLKVSEELNIEDIYYESVKDSKSEAVFENIKKEWGKDTNIDRQIELSKSKADRFSLNPLFGDRSSNYMFINGAFFELTASFQQQISNSLQFFINHLQQAVMMNQIGNKGDVYGYFLNLFNAKTYRNPYFITSDLMPLKMIDIPSKVGRFNLEIIKYFEPITNSFYPLNVWIFGSGGLSTQKAVFSLLKYVSSSEKHAGNCRFSIFNTGNRNWNIDLFINVLSQAFGDEEFIFLGERVDSYSLSKRIVRLTTIGFPSLFDDSSLYIVVNGRVVGPFPENFHVKPLDIAILLDYEYEKVSPVVDIIGNYRSLKEKKSSNLVLWTISSIFNAAILHSKTSAFDLGTLPEALYRIPDLLKFSETVSCIRNKRNGSSVDIVAFIDPISDKAPKTIHILEELSKTRYLSSVYVYLIPEIVGAEELLIRRLYRFSFHYKPHFDSTGEFSSFLSFQELPSDVLFTLGFDEPQRWVVMPRKATFDLDNIFFNENSNLHVLLELKYLLVEGYARELNTFLPPRGLQIIIEDSLNNLFSDTIVMANLGYYQLKALSGIWYLKLREGKSSEFYSFSTLDYNHVKVFPVDDGRVQILLDSFDGLQILTRVLKNPTKEGSDILDDGGTEHETSSWWSSLFHFFNDSNQNTVINVFSVASGHLYERFLRIMIISVLKNSKHSVKFWFIEDFLSPEFKQFLPVYAERINFKFELVTYKWPEWLRAQPEKQRKIWGYKILFLDVLFPLDLEKVIFVDADQIVRTDLKQLIDMDIHGAPYAYTPFCNSRKETEGFRFWNGGYWKKHLRGKPYHISALYVVDLKRFRQIAAGDRLRQQYQMLSSDPNSLANLDQDLPNDMQHSVPIFSLPQEWLWCETWCDDASLKDAKTIDLCNNPLTKEPKLDRARRLLPEWSIFDKEQKEIYQSWKMNTTRESKEEVKHDEL